MMSLAIPAAGLVTPVGMNAAATLAALRAGIRQVNETNLWDPESGTYLAAGKVPLPQWWTGIGKWADLAAPAILECLQAADSVTPSQIPLLLGLPAPDRPFRPAKLDATILPEISERLGFRLHPASRTIARDHVSIVVALREAATLIEQQRVPYVVVAAVDSLLQQDLKEYYRTRRRLLTPAHSNGFSLGEAGSAVLVTRAASHLSDALHILGAGLNSEKATIESEEPLRAEGLTNAIREAMQQAAVCSDDLHYRITDLNGEHYKFKEMTLAMMRFPYKPKPKLFDLWHPAEYIGDVGTAMGPLVLAVALHAGRKGYALGRLSLCTFGNDDGERGAIVAAYPGQELHR